MARAIGEKPSTVASWKRVGRIPAEKQPTILKVAELLNLPITAENVVFPFGRTTDDLAQSNKLVACDQNRKAQRKGPSQ